MTCVYEEAAYYLGWSTWTCSRALSSRNLLPQTPRKLWWGAAGCHTCPSLWLRTPSRGASAGNWMLGMMGTVSPGASHIECSMLEVFLSDKIVTSLLQISAQHSQGWMPALLQLWAWIKRKVMRAKHTALALHGSHPVWPCLSQVGLLTFFWDITKGLRWP